MSQLKLIIKTSTQKYPVIIGSNLVSKLKKIIENNAIKFNQCLLIIDKNVPKSIIYKLKKNFIKKKIYIILIKANEKNKSQKTINNILETLLNKNFSRQDCLISVGGGITGDVGGFAASIFKRGLQFINIPTTLLSQVDSSIGGKTGINSKHGKNLIGSFYQPKLVVSDTNFLKTLPQREIICGYGEILKHSLIANKSLYQFLDKHILHILNIKSPFIEKVIFQSCKIKKEVVEKDEKEKNLRKILNFGHTFAHAFEASLNYSKKLNHGEAVLLGIYMALKFSYKNKYIKKKEYESVIKHIKNSGLPFDIKIYFSSKHLNKILSFMIKDKKNHSKNVNLILLKKIGSPVINNYFTVNFLRKFLSKELVN